MKARYLIGAAVGLGTGIVGCWQARELSRNLDEIYKQHNLQSILNLAEKDGRSDEEEFIYQAHKQNLIVSNSLIGLAFFGYCYAATCMWRALARK